MSQPLYRRAPETIFTTVDEDIVALNVRYGRCYGMEMVTAAVWRMMEEPMDVASICEQLQKDYDVDPYHCREDIERLISQFRSEGLIEEVSEATTSLG